MDFSKCQCANAGWCHIFNKEMTYDPPNWQWCQSLSEDQRESYHNSLRKSSAGGIIKKANNDNEVDIINFYDELPQKVNDYAICVIPANDSAMELLNITRDSIKKYANKYNADYIELSGDQNPNWTMANKYRLYYILTKYSKTLYLDCDVFIKDNSPNIFEITPDDKISAYDEFSFFEKNNTSNWILTEQEIILHYINNHELNHKYINNGIFSNNVMLNGGVLVIPKELAHYYKQPETPYPKQWCFDQNLLTLILPKDKLYNLSYKFNCEYVTRDFWYNIYDAYFIHLNAMKEKADFRKYLLNQFNAGDFALHEEEMFGHTKYHVNSLKKADLIHKDSFIDSNYFSKNKIGIFFNNLVPGGALTWLNDFVQFYKDDITGIVAIEDFPQYNHITAGLQRGFTVDHMYELYEKSDIIIYWLYWVPSHRMSIPDFWCLNQKNKKVIFLSHGSFRISVINDLLNFFKPNKFVCVDELVTRHYNGIYIPPIIRTQNIQRKPIKKNVLWHHRLDANKGLQTLADIIEAMPDYIFHIAGNWMPAINYEKTVELVESRILCSDIENVFYYEHLDDISELLSICSLSLSTSLDESFGISIAESIANGVPSISHPVGIGMYSDKIVRYKAHYGEWVKTIRICDQSIETAKNKDFIKTNYTEDRFKKSWDDVLWS